MLESVSINWNFSKIIAADHKKTVASSVQTKIFKEGSDFPESYNLENTKIHQLWWTKDDLDFDQLGQQLNFQIKTVSSILLPPGSCIPLHRDTFHRLRTEYPDTPGKMLRAVIYATEYDLGQFTQYVNQGVNTVFTDWQIGQGHIWDDQVPHVTANASYRDLITVNISGFRQ